MSRTARHTLTLAMATEDLAGDGELLNLRQAAVVLKAIEHIVLTAIEQGYDRITLGKGLTFRITWIKPKRRPVGFGKDQKVVMAPGSYRLVLVSTQRLRKALKKRQTASEPPVRDACQSATALGFE